MTIAESVLEILGKNKELTLNQIVRLSGKDRGNVYKYLNKFVSNGLVTVEEKEKTTKVKFFSIK